MKFLFETFIVILALLLILGLAYSVLSPMLEGLGIELDGIFNQFTSDESDETNKSDDTTQVSETTVPAECKHEYVEDKWFYKNETHHKAVCKICGKGEKTKEHIWGANGICTLCDYVKPDSGDTDTHECKFDNLSDETEEGYHILVCSVDGCGKTVPEDHEYGDGKWQISVEPTCTEKGEETRACTVCKRLARRNIAALGHDWENGVCSMCSLVCQHVYGSDGICYTCGLYDAQQDPEMRCQHLNAYYDWSAQIDCTVLHYDLFCPDCNYYENLTRDESHDWLDTLIDCVSVSSTQHIETWVYVCTRCSVEQGGSGTNEWKDHEFVNGLCLDCGYSAPDDSSGDGSGEPSEECSHSSTTQSDYSSGCTTDSRYPGVHIWTYEVICDYCGEVVNYTEETESHNFVNGTCENCGEDES